jgi:hypothetical protein
MPLSSEARERCRAFLQPGEETRYLIPGDLGLAGARRARDGPFIRAISDTAVTVLSCGWLRRHRPHLGLGPPSPRHPARPGGHLVRAVPTDPLTLPCGFLLLSRWGTSPAGHADSLGGKDQPCRDPYEPPA